MAITLWSKGRACDVCVGECSHPPLQLIDDVLCFAFSTLGYGMAAYFALQGIPCVLFIIVVLELSPCFVLCCMHLNCGGRQHRYQLPTQPCLVEMLM